MPHTTGEYCAFGQFLPEVLIFIIFIFWADWILPIAAGAYSFFVLAFSHWQTGETFIMFRRKITHNTLQLMSKASFASRGFIFMAASSDGFTNACDTYTEDWFAHVNASAGIRPRTGATPSPGRAMRSPCLWPPGSDYIKIFHRPNSFPFANRNFPEGWDMRETLQWAINSKQQGT